MLYKLFLGLYYFVKELPRVGESVDISYMFATLKSKPAGVLTFVVSNTT
jgi:hypothetical protein